MTDIAHQRLRSQRLVGTSLETPEAAVQWLGAVQSQDYAGAKWALGQRVEVASSAVIDQLFNAGRILRTHLMRPTWHFVVPADLRWLLHLTAPRVHAANAYYYRKFELDEAVLKKSAALLANTLQGGKQLTRTEVAQALQAAGIAASGLRLGYILMHAELDAVICSGALNGKRHTYALLDERVPQAEPLAREEALAELARRYFASHGPALSEDFVWWSGLTTADARAAIAAANLMPYTENGKTYWRGEGDASKHSASTVHLLPNYDEYVIAYKDRSVLASSVPFTVTPPAGIFDGHILVVNGKVAGAWRVTTKGKAAAITAVPLTPLGGAERTALRLAVEDYGEFSGTRTELLFG